MSLKQRFFKWLSDSQDAEELNQIREKINQDIKEFKTYVENDVRSVKTDVLDNIKKDVISTEVTKHIMHLLSNNGSENDWTQRYDNKVVDAIRRHIRDIVHKTFEDVKSSYKLDVDNKVNSEKFLDDIVTRLKNKQL